MLQLFAFFPLFWEKNPWSCCWKFQAIERKRWLWARWPLGIPIRRWVRTRVESRSSGAGNVELGDTKRQESNRIQKLLRYLIFLTLQESSIFICFVMMPCCHVFGCWDETSLSRTKVVRSAWKCRSSYWAPWPRRYPQEDGYYKCFCLIHNNL